MISNRIFHWRDLRTRFYPVLNDMLSAYLIRMEDPEGRYWKNVIGYLPAPEDEAFVEHRATFVGELVQYNELKEIRMLRRRLLDNHAGGHHNRGEAAILDLAPELEALSACLATLHKKLKI